MKDKIQLFEDRKVRSVWDDEKEEWFFSIVDVCCVLAQTNTPRRYWSDLKRKLKKEGAEQVYDKIVQLKMLSSDGKSRQTDAANIEQLLRIIQSIPSPRAEPFKQWLAQVGAERINETIDPELAIQRAKRTYEAKGMPKDWINQRIQGIKTRNELTDAWKENGVTERSDFSILTNLIHQETFGISIKQHKSKKGLKKENLRDNMTTLETALTMLAEATTTEYEKQEKPKTIQAHKKVAKAGGAVASQARKTIEQRTGQKVVSNKNAIDLIEEKKRIENK